MRSAVNQIWRKLRSGEIALGVNVQTASPEMVEMVGIAGYDHVMIDWEHGSFGVETVVAMIRAADAVGITPIVRVPGHDEAYIKRALDAGALGVVVPQVDTREQAERICAAARYFDGANNGARGACPSVRATGHLATNWEEFALTTNSELFVGISIESREGIRNFAEIVEVPGMSAVFLGTFDLAQSMGQFSNTRHPDVQSELQSLFPVARSKGMPVFATLMGGTPDETLAEQRRWQENGASIFNVISDRRLATLGLRNRLEGCRPSAG